MGKANRIAVQQAEVPLLKEQIKKLEAEAVALNSKLLKLEKEPNVEELAKLFHESGREAVLNNKVLKPDGAPIGQIVFKEWDQITEDAREGRRIQSRFFLAKCNISLK
jgi:predicted nuclease with TOPRIM domain